MKRGLGTTLLAIYLLLRGLMTLLGFSFPMSGTVMALLMLFAGLLLLLGK